MNPHCRAACSMMVLLMTGCAAQREGAEEGQAPEAVAAETSALLSAISVENFHGADARLFDDYDWAYGSWKGECGGAAGVLAGFSFHVASGTSFGVYDTAEWWSQGLLCASSQVGVNNSNPRVAVASQVLWMNHGDDRLDNALPDWAPEEVKAECGSNEVVVGVAGATADSTQSNISAVRCMPGTNLYAPATCYAVSSQGRDDRSSTSGGDWSYGYVKLQCADGDYVKGIAQYHDKASYNYKDGYGLYSLLCCTPNLAGPGSATRLVAPPSTGIQQGISTSLR